MAYIHPSSPDLQNSYGLEAAPSDDPQTIVDDAPEALHPGQPGVTVYSEQAEKNANGYLDEPPARKTICGLPLLVFGLVVTGILLLGVALGAGLGVGLNNQRSSSNSSASTTTSAGAVTTSTGGSSTTATPTPTLSSSSSSSSSSSTTLTTSTKTSTSTSATATATGDASVEICQNAYLDYCTTISVPADSCSMLSTSYPPIPLILCESPYITSTDVRFVPKTVNFSSSYNDSVSSVDTGGPTCSFYT